MEIIVISNDLSGYDEEDEHDFEEDVAEDEEE